MKIETIVVRATSRQIGWLIPLIEKRDDPFKLSVEKWYGLSRREIEKLLSK